MKKANNIILLSLLVGLIIVFVGLRIFRAPGRERSLPAHLTSIDSTLVTSIDIRSSKQPGELIQLMKSDKTWGLKSGSQEGQIEPGIGPSALRAIMELKPVQLITNKSSKWNEFGVSDSTGTRVKVMHNDEVLADVWFGKTGFVQNPQGGFGGSHTYVRLEGEDEVYSAEGFLEGRFSRSFSDWRDKRFMKFPKDSVVRITFAYPDSSFVINKLNGKWIADGQQLDSAAVLNFVMRLSLKNLNTFATAVPVGNAAVSVTFESAKNLLAKAEGWPGSAGWTLRGNVQPATYFSSDGKDVFRGKGTFLKKAK